MRQTISTNALGSIAALSSTMATFLILLLSPNILIKLVTLSTKIVFLIPLKLICSNHDSVRRAHEAHLIDKAMTLERRDINRHDELYS